MTAEVLEELREEIYDALSRGDELRAKAGIDALRRDEPAEAVGLLTALHIEAGRIEEALDAWAECARRAPDDAYTVFLRARIHLMQQERGAALALLRPLMRAPMPAAVAEKVFNLAGQCARFFGYAAEAVECYAHARDAAPDAALRALNASNVLFNRHYLPATLAEERRAAEEYGALFADVPTLQHRFQPEGARRLRIGYLSPDVREHVVLSFSRALFSALDRQQFEVFVYALNEEDACTEAVRRSVDGFRNLLGIPPAEAARIIYADEIDILVDLAGHTAGGTLPIMAYRPAPIQVSGIGYFASTGLRAVDYFLADPILAAGHAQDGFTEELLLLPHSHFCWCPLHAAPPLRHTPASGRPIVFGSFNNFTKVNDAVLAVWAKILRRVPDAKLLLKAEIFSYADGRAEAERRIAAAGIPLERVLMEGNSADYMAAYSRMDIALDTFPYPGGGTTCDALYMGVPVVTLAGESVGSRFGASLLTNIGAGALAAHTEEEYIELAVALAGDAEQLDALHLGLRAMMETSPLMDAAAYGQEVGAAYQRIWAAYAASRRTAARAQQVVRPFMQSLARRSHDRLRIGYISPDFAPHVVMNFARAFFLHANHDRFAVYGYALCAKNEAGAALAAHADGWRWLQGYTPQDAAQVIHEDEIDILFDLSGHTSENALPILAYRPAPVQVSGIGYFASTGLKAVDYFLADSHTVQTGEENAFTEQLLILPSSHLCYLPLLPQDMPHMPPPCKACGIVTFGSLGDAAKFSDALLAVWGRILASVPQARLFLKSGAFDDDTLSRDLRTRMARMGIDPERTVLAGRSADYMTAYGDIDIALDTFPYPGGTTCDALYMGVPVVTLAGRSHHENFGKSILENVGLPELVAADVDAYVETAVHLAQNPARLTALRGILRYRLLAAPLGSGARYMAELEEGYREIWRRWCAAQGQPVPPEDIKQRIFDALEEERYAEARVLTEAALHAGAQDDMLQYLYAYAVERMGDLPQAMALSEAYSRAERKDLRHEFMRLRAALGYRMGDRRAAAFYLQAHEEEPSDTGLYSSFLLAQNAQEADEAELFRVHRAYERFFDAVPQYTHSAQYRHEKVRVGYISPDFRRNVMRHFIQPFLTGHDRTRFEVYAYSTAEQPDDVTAALRAQPDVWRDMGGIQPDEAAARIHADEIDILVDLAGHAAGGALPVLARRPAPIQMTGLGYTATSGLSMVDYFLTDAACDPPYAGHEQYFTERLIRLPSQFCYVPQANLPAAQGTPARARGSIVFGVFNQYRKFTDEMLLLWREILARVPTAQLLIKAQILFSPAMTEAAYMRFMNLGFDMGRVIFEPADTGYMRRYLDVDIALDTYPWPGGGTTCDALYMGVPVVSLYSARRSTRFSYALLSHVGLEELAVHRPEDYVARAAALALDIDTLDGLHRGLRGMMERSPVMDQPGYMRALEESYLHCMETLHRRELR